MLNALIIKYGLILTSDEADILAISNRIEHWMKEEKLV